MQTVPERLKNHLEPGERVIATVDHVVDDDDEVVIFRVAGGQRLLDDGTRLEGLGVKHIFEVDTYQQAKLKDLVVQATAVDEFSVVIARHPCMLKFTREQRRKSCYRQKHVKIDQDRCERVYACIKRFGCPTFSRDANGRITINTDLCISDGSCIQTCPTRAILPADKN